MRKEHLDRAILLPDRLALADLLPKGGAGAEIGVAFGQFTSELVARTRPERLYLIDSWDSDRFRNGYEQVKNAYPDAIILRGLSTLRIAEIPDRSLDWCYIDTDHMYETTSLELEMILPKMKSRGRIAGDDYSPGNPAAGLFYGVVPAVSEFCHKYGWQFEYLTMEWNHNPSFCLRKI